MRFGLELIEAVRAAWPADRPLFFRGSCVDGRGGIWNLEDTIVLAKELKDRGVDVFDCSSGGIDGPLTLHVVPRVPDRDTERGSEPRKASPTAGSSRTWRGASIAWSTA